MFHVLLVVWLTVGSEWEVLTMVAAYVHMLNDGKGGCDRWWVV